MKCEPIEPTEDEKRNGWTTETLTQYLADREKAQSAAVLDRKPARQTRANSKYRPLRWRG